VSTTHATRSTPTQSLHHHHAPNHTTHVIALRRRKDRHHRRQILYARVGHVVRVAQCTTVENKQYLGRVQTRRRRYEAAQRRDQRVAPNRVAQRVDGALKRDHHHDNLSIRRWHDASHEMRSEWRKHRVGRDGSDDEGAIKRWTPLLNAQHVPRVCGPNTGHHIEHVTHVAHGCRMREWKLPGHCLRTHHGRGRQGDPTGRVARLGRVARARDDNKARAHRLVMQRERLTSRGNEMRKRQAVRLNRERLRSRHESVGADGGRVGGA